MNERMDSVRMGRVTIYKRRNGIWYADYTIGQVRKRESIGTRSKKVAVDWATDKNTRLVREDLGIADDRIPIPEVIKRFMKHQQEQTSNAPSTIRRYRGALRALARFLQAKPSIKYLGQLDVDTLEQFRSYRLEQGRDHKTIDGDMAAISGMFTFAVERRMCRENPARKIKYFRVPKPRPPVYTAKEVDAMVDAASGYFRDVLVILANTGLRVGELEHLEWQDIDLDKGLIHIRIKTDWRPKDKSERSIPINDAVREVLERRHRNTHWVITDERGNPVRERKLLKELRWVQSLVGVAEGTLHTFRHFFISKCANSSIDPFTCMSWVGHADLMLVPV